MKASEYWRELHPWDRALLALHIAEQVTRGNANLPLGHTDTDRQVFQMLESIRGDLREATWTSTSVADEVLQGARKNIPILTNLINDRIERREVYEAHALALDLYIVALQQPIPPAVGSPNVDEYEYVMTDYGKAPSELTDALLEVSSSQARAPREWWVDVWNRQNGRTSNPISPRFTLYLDPGDSSVGEMRELLAALNALHKAVGGNGFVFSIEGDRLVMSPAVQ